MSGVEEGTVCFEWGTWCGVRKSSLCRFLARYEGKSNLDRSHRATTLTPRGPSEETQQTGLGLGAFCALGLFLNLLKGADRLPWHMPSSVKTPAPSRRCRESWMSPSVVEPISAARGGEKNSASCTFACEGISEGPVKQARAKMSQDEGHSKAARPIPIFAKIELHYLIIRLARIAPSSSAPTAIGTSPRTKLPRFIRPGDSNGLTQSFHRPNVVGSRPIAQQRWKCQQPSSSSSQCRV